MVCKIVLALVKAGSLLLPLAKFLRNMNLFAQYMVSKIVIEDAAIIAPKNKRPLDGKAPTRGLKFY